MESSGVAFGTSGARGLANKMTDKICYAYTSGFLQHLKTKVEFAPYTQVGIAGDLRPSTPRIMRACARAIIDSGYIPVNCGYIPTPALAYWGISKNIPTVMVTGSHIPDDRNGIKFYTPCGEILKDDEVGIRKQQVNIPTDILDAEDNLIVVGIGSSLPIAISDAYNHYCQRYTNFFPHDALSGLNIAIYQHSSVASAVLHKVLSTLGATVELFAHSEQFIPVDTEALRPEDQKLAIDKAASGNYNCIVSTDGDGDRPLIFDEQGQWLRGDTLGILTAHYLQAKTVVTPVNSNTALELSGWFYPIKRTQIGSPYVIADMLKAKNSGYDLVVGYEANGGFLLGSKLTNHNSSMEPLITRDAVLVILSTLLLSRQLNLALSQLPTILPKRFTYSDSLKLEARTIADALISKYLKPEAMQSGALAKAIEPDFGPIISFNTVDGVRMLLKSGDILHLRPSNNSPEFRVYTETNSLDGAKNMSNKALQLITNWSETLK
ncbi:hypothetical protein TI04_00325 [Achromatium sp. WMS2]|nr:hypothetical protein TI04_00325 [Achromatium sp. WMS2]